jgi:8-oxo-dGTP pyrophosphatase MutT (NUDIX family)
MSGDESHTFAARVSFTRSVAAKSSKEKSLESAPSITLKRRRVAFENSRFRVFEDHIADSRGAEVRDYLVVAPHTSREDLITGISVLPVCDERIVLLRTFRHAISAMQLEVARGFVDADEDPADAALRELSEETGLECHREDLISLGTCTPEGSTLAARVALYAATKCRPGNHTLDAELGLGGCEYLSLAEASQRLREMSIEDVSTALVLHRYFQWRDRR